jgi:hypothetical protein
LTTNAVATGFWTAQNANNARQGRALLQSVFLSASATSPLSSARSGVIPTSGDGTNYYDLRVTVSSGLTMSVSPGTGVVGRSGQGIYESWLLPPAASVIADPAPSTNPRNDLVVLRIYDAAQGDTVPGSGANLAQIEVITGTPGSIPADPVTRNADGSISNWSTAPVPAQAAGGGVGIPLARAQVSTGGVITLTDLRRSTFPLGGLRPLLPGDSLSDPGYLPGEQVLSGSVVYTWSGSAWVATDLVASNLGYAEYSQTAAQTIATNTDQRALWDTAVVSSPDISVSTVSGGTVFTVNRAGVWDVSGTIRINGAAGNGIFERAVVLSTTSAIAYRFGGMNNYDPNLNAAPSPNYVQTQYPIIGKKRFAVGDVFAVWIWQSSGGGLATNVGLGANRVAMKWLGP